MESVPASDEDVVLALRALAQGIRLEVLGLLAASGHEGLSAGEIALRLGIPPASLSFHFQPLVQARLLTRRRRSRQIIYAPNLPRMRWLLARLRDQWLSPQAGEHQYPIRSFPVELAQDELELVAGGGKSTYAGTLREYFDIPLILEIFDNSTSSFSLN